MFFLIFILSLLRGYTSEAIPIFLQERASPPSNPSSDGGLETRTMLSIIWGCVSTTFVCTWVSVHPNVPPRPEEEFGWRTLLRRLRLMFWALIAPELVLAWSAKQWYVAGQIADTYNHSKGIKEEGERNGFPSYLKSYIRGKQEKGTQVWKRTHGHLIAMGGIVLVESESDNQEPGTTRCHGETILTFEILQELLVQDNEFEINITDKEIEDKAKGDFLSKSIVILQTTWFIMQCVARFIQKIAVTELEIVTLALASLNAIMFFFWWNKPLGLTVPMKIHLKRPLKRKMAAVMQPALQRIVDNIQDKFALRLLWNLCHSRPVLFSFLLLPSLVFLLLFYIFLFPIILIARSVYDVMATNSIPSTATHVPAFYSPKAGLEIVVFRLIFPIFGAVFGGLHCLGWSFLFPTQTEQRLWRVASLTITVIPLLYGIFSLADNSTGARKPQGPMSFTMKVIVGVLGSLLVALACVYMLSRLTLLVEAVVLLRKQPSSAFLAVEWAKFLPHINVDFASGLFS